VVGGLYDQSLWLAACREEKKRSLGIDSNPFLSIGYL
jgi:hypothetical protein